MTEYSLQITLQSDATFGCGDGVPGLVDHEVEYDQYGFPYLRGKTLKGLLAEECANILYALREQKKPIEEEYRRSAGRLFGQPGSRRQDAVTLLRVGDARLPQELRQTIQLEIIAGRLTPAQVLESITAIRRQTAVDVTGKPETGSLRASRVVLRNTVFEASLHLDVGASNTDLNLLAACVQAFRRAGIHRNRGLGKLTAKLLAADRSVLNPQPFEAFKNSVEPTEVSG